MHSGSASAGRSYIPSVWMRKALTGGLVYPVWAEVLRHGSAWRARTRSASPAMAKPRPKPEPPQSATAEVFLPWTSELTPPGPNRVIEQGVA